jgi:NAD+ synthase
MRFHRDILALDGAAEAGRISAFIQDHLARFRREGAVIGLSGGVDSALAASLCVRALGPEKVFGLVLPERESNPLSREYALKEAQRLGIRVDLIDITPVLEAFGTYQKRDEAVREAFPLYGPGCRSKIVLPADLLARDAFNFFSLKVVDGEGKESSFRLKKETLMKIIAATDTKQRTRMMHLYYRAERMNYLVCGTTNRSETVQGYFVKYGDGGVDLEPIAHLYKTQVFQLAGDLGVIEEIRRRAPSPDTFSLEVSDEEFYFRMPYETLDLLLYAWENTVPPPVAAEALRLSLDQVQRAFRDFASKFKATEHLRSLAPSLLSPR